MTYPLPLTRRRRPSITTDFPEKPRRAVVEFDAGRLQMAGWAVLAAVWGGGLLALWLVLFPRGGEVEAGFPFNGYYVCAAIVSMEVAWNWRVCSWIGMEMFRYLKGSG